MTLPIDTKIRRGGEQNYLNFKEPKSLRTTDANANLQMPGAFFQIESWEGILFY